MKKQLTRIFTAMVAAAMLPAVPAVTAAAAPAEPYAPVDLTVVLDPSKSSPFNGGSFEGWGTSLCWWANRLGYSEKLTQQAADAFFSEDGLSLDIARYNLGGGDDPSHNHITRSDSKVPGYAVGFDENGGIIYDWSADENQRNIALAALKANPDLYFEGFSNSPPYFMTVTGCSSGGDPAGSDNLKPEYRDDFAKFIAEATKHFKDEFGITFKSYSPMNEPDTAYWGVNSPKQEGCHYDPGESESAMIIETRKALDACGLTDVLVAAMDETNIDQSVSNLDKLSDEAKAALGRIDTHTYGGSQRAELKAKAQELNRDLWMSEVDGGWDGIGLAKRIILDMNGMQPSAWVMWDIVDFHRDSDFTAPDGTKPEANNTLDPTKGLWGVGMADHDKEVLELSNKYYTFGQFTKYIEPGDTIIASSDYTLAAYDRSSGTIKIAALNDSDSNRRCVIDLSAFNKVGKNVRMIRSDNDTEKWKEIKNGAVLDGKKITTELKPKSVTTYIIENNIKDIGYISIDGADIAVKGGAYTYTASSSDGSAVKWSVSDENVAVIDENGTLTPIKGGTTEVVANSTTVGTASMTVTVSDAPKLDIDASMVSGSEAWNNNYNTSFYKAVDNDTSTYFDGLNGGNVTIDLGEPHSIAMLGYAPRKDYERRMTDGRFSGSNDGISWTELYCIKNQPIPNQLTYITSDAFDSGTPYRYIRYSVPETSSSDYACNIAELVIYAEPAGMTDEQAVAKAAELYVPEKVYGNINMPPELNGVNISWNSSDSSVIGTDGTVTLGAEPKTVTITAEFSKGDAREQKVYNVTVKEAVPQKETSAYLFAHFSGTESNAESEQIYFSLSKDGTKWTTLNEGAPILMSNVGEGGVRDPHIIRSPEGNRFFLIATDLSIYNRRNDPNRWGTCQTSGSKSIVIWESDDLVNWSEARLIKVSKDNAGCTWAPESVYDDAKGAYMVFWASKTADDDYRTQRIYRSYTRDFVTFTDPEVYMDGGTISNIDTTFAKDGGTYYRFTKNESKSSVIMEKSTSLDGPFEAVSTYRINGKPGNEVTGYEGPTAYKINGTDNWCLLLDFYSKGQGYKPFVTGSIADGNFRSGSDFRFDTKYRHGTVIAITQEEYDALMAKYPPTGAPESGSVIFDADFSGESPALGQMVYNGTIEGADESCCGGSAVKLNSGDYIELKSADGGSLLKGLDSFTAELTVKANAQSWLFYAAPDTTSQVYESEKYTGILDNGSKLTAERYMSEKQGRPNSPQANYREGEWKHVTVTYSKTSTSVYVNGERVSTIRSAVDISDLMGNDPVVYIGKANWGDGEYSDMIIDSVKIYDYALSEDEVAANYAAILDKIEFTVQPDGAYSVMGVPADMDVAVTAYDSSGAIAGTAIGRSGIVNRAEGGEAAAYIMYGGAAVRVLKQ